MDKTWKDALAAEALELGIALDLGAVDRLAGHIDLLLKWNAKLNLTRITAPADLRHKHVLDALIGLAVVPPGPQAVLDLGSGGGFPGIPWAIARPDLQVTLVDAVQKKVSFLKSCVATLGLTNVRALHVRLEGQAERERLAPGQVVTSRAFTQLGDFLSLARPYLQPGGCAVAYLGPAVTAAEARVTAAEEDFEIESLHHAALPGGGGARLVLRAVPRGTSTRPGPPPAGNRSI